MFNRLLGTGLVALFGFAFTGCCSVAPCGTGTCASSQCGPGLLPGRLAARVASQLASPCTSGCGEVYWDERINHPPVCDPCGGVEYAGTSCGECRPLLSRLGQFWGTPYMGGCECGAPSCDSCASPGLASYSPVRVTAPAHSSGYCASCAAASGSHQAAAPVTTQTEHYTTHETHATQAQPTPAKREVHTETHDVAPHDTHDAHEAPVHHDSHAEPDASGHDDHHAETWNQRKVRPVSTRRVVTR